jgi:putative ABC transport system permease protein
LPRTAYPGAQAAGFFDRLAERLSAVPGVESVAATSSVPLSGAENLRQITIEGRPKPDPGREIIADFRLVTPNYFGTMGIARVAGEPLSRAATADGVRELLINSMIADAYFQGENPIGRRIKLTAFDQDSPWFTVKGVVADTRHTALDSAFRPQVYIHHVAEPSSQMVIVMRTRSDPAQYASVARAGVYELDPNQPAGRIRTMTAMISDAAARQRFTMLLAGTFAGISLILSIGGLYAVVSYSVAERTRELGVRSALGATPLRLLRLVLSDGMRLVAIGVLIGIPAALALSRFLETQLFGVTAHDPGTFIAATVLLMCAAIAGCLIPARRATRIDPMTALRTE